ncbi:MAG: nucleotidyltransferase domain-containing protein [Nanoarchaeota archaeon]|nr:nucleotidyltransferase domain-containing protein [Nanoarchaeota archaeon]
MITKVNDIGLKILSLFTNGFNKEHYIRQVEKMLRISSRSALVNLDKLEKQGILESQTKGKIKAYRIRDSLISRESFILTEQYKKLRFLHSNQVIKEIIEKSDNLMHGIVIIFGSYAKGIQKEDSDLDLFLIGRFEENSIKEIGIKYGIRINMKSYPKSLFLKEFHEDILLKEILENHIIIKGTEEFVREAKKWIR